jgi:hypothetical protein
MLKAYAGGDRGQGAVRLGSFTMMRVATLARWTGRGDFRSFRTTVEGRLGGARDGVVLASHGYSLVIEGLEPLTAAAELRHLPGVSWIAAGFRGRSLGELAEQASVLARRYLRKGDRFGVAAEASGGSVASDVAGAVTSAVLGAVKGARVAEGAPKVRFRAAFDGSSGVVGVEVNEGPGGEPTGEKAAVCLVSGGRHSSVVAWMALVAGYRLTLVHARENDLGLREVARLYSELSHRVDPRTLSLRVLEGDGAMGTLVGAVREGEGPFFSGFRETNSVPAYFRGRLLAPLFLLPDSEFDRLFRELALRGDDRVETWRRGRKGGSAKWVSFGGVEADVSDVLGGLG